MSMLTPHLAMIALLAGQQAAPSPPRAPQAMREIAPPLARYTDDLLFGDVWKRLGLSPRDRSLVTVSALIGSGKAAQLTSHLNLALDNGVEANTLSALMTNAAFVAGWPNAVSAIAVAKEVFDRRGVAVTRAPDARVDRMAETGTPLQRYAPVTDALWARDDLTPRDRALATLAILVAAGDHPALPAVLARGRAAGLTRAEVEEALLHLSFYAGRPRAELAAPLVAAAYEAGAAGMTVVRRGTDKRTGPPATFTGKAVVTTPFAGTGAARIAGATVRFAAGARTHWHRHPLGQTLAVTKGCGWTQVEGGPVRRICAGDIVSVDPGAKHWHGASAKSAMTHVAIAERQDGKSVEWLEPVSNAQYAAGRGSD